MLCALGMQQCYIMLRSLTADVKRMHLYICFSLWLFISKPINTLFNFQVSASLLLYIKFGL